ncbi:two-component system regulatory protein YycI [Bacillus suaedaesalsae]|uniref:Two-component system regulatory protein YycI n=1 Tax=Bacillus suaedaesalsae TaxID=2810349 RepID=A0ABS2DEL9_9BACI|nr:two-component system regulatory protein YycI [Bacillus suaedaesalsae]MBM6616907.1 two-component system regulatory protein YycI [Bacillus suaedaesalsae]
MDWRKTKTIFIIVFLILDVFLLFQFVEKRNSNQLGLLAEKTLEEQLEDNDISIEISLPKGPMNETYISGTSRQFDAEDLLPLKGQQAQILNKSQIYSKFTTPIPIKEDSRKWLEDFVKQNVIEGSSYVFWGLEEEKHELLFFQVFNGKTIFYNENAVLHIQLNDKDEMVEYYQTYLEEIEEMNVDGDKTESFTALKAIENMYERNELKPGSVVTDVDLGYYTLVKDSQVFVPTWHFIIDNKESYFVNALEGHIIRDAAQWRDES